MATVHDVAAYVLQKKGSMSTMKLQKLCYYSQAWHLVWDEEPLFDSEIQAWMNGPVIRELYNRHRGRFNVSEWAGNPDELTPSEKETVDLVLGAYGKYTGQQLSDLTHRERPWIEAREGLTPSDRSEAPVSLDVMQEYYSFLESSEESESV